MCASQASLPERWMGRAEPISHAQQLIQSKPEMLWRGSLGHRQGLAPMGMYWFAAFQCDANLWEVLGEIAPQHGVSLHKRVTFHVPWFVMAGR